MVEIFVFRQMSDRQIIINFLQATERRTRANRLLHDISYAFAVSLLFPLSFKLWDLVSPFRATTVLVVHGLWLAGFLAYSAWRLTQKGTLAQSAAALDSKAALNDELKTAYWFINNPRPSEWVDAQIQKAAARAQRLDVSRLYPRSMPRTAYLAVAMFILTIGLNFVPLPWNNNWLVLQAAPVYALSDQERALLEQTMELLEKAQQLEQTDVIDRLQEIVQQLQSGDISPSDAAQQLDDIASLLGDNAVDLSQMYAGLSEIAKEFEKSDQLKDAASALENKNLAKAGEELRELAEKLASLPTDTQKDVEKRLQEASEKEAPGLDDLTKNLEEAAKNLQEKNEQGAGQALQKAAGDLQKLGQQIDRMKAMQQAGQSLKGLSQAMMQRLQSEQQQQGEKGEGGEQADGDASNQQMPGGEKGQPGEGTVPGSAPAPGSGSGEGGGLEPSVPMGVSSQEEGPPTSLDVQLEKETLTGQHDQGGKPDELEEASKQERSKLDYRNVESDLTPAQKDLLNQDRIPWEYRPLIKNYFQAIKPPKQPTQ